MSKKITIYGWYSLLAIVFLVKIFLIWYTFWHRHYLVPPGNDVVGHFTILNNIIVNKSANFTTYPPGFHLLVLLLSKITHQNIWAILTNWTPVLILIPGMVTFFLLRQIFSLRVAVLTVAIFLLTSAYPTYAFIDGNYPDMLAYGCFSLLLFFFLIRYFKTANIINLFWSLIFLILIAITHNFTFFNVFSILVVFGLLELFIYLWVKPISIFPKLALIFSCFIAVIIIGYFLASKLYGALPLDIILGIFRHHAYLADNYLNTPNEYNEYPNLIGQLVWYFGLAGFFVLLISSYKNNALNKTKQLAIIWFVTLFLFSRLGTTGIPARFTRELALPLTIFCAFFFDYVLEKNPLKIHLGQIFAYGLIGYLIVINSAFYTGIDRIPTPYDDHVWYWPIDADKASFIAATVASNQTVVYNPSANPFFAVKTQSKIYPLKLSSEQIQKVRNYLDYPNNNQYKKSYEELLTEVRNQNRENYIFSDVKPPSNPSGDVYPVYKNYEEKKKVLDDLGASGKVIKIFDDSATLYKIK